MKESIRECGILMPISSLHSPYGIGTLGLAASEFADFVKQSGAKLWQVLPVGPTGYGDSPYQSFSVFAGNPYFIDLDTLISDGLLKKDEVKGLRNPKQIDYKSQYDKRFAVLRKAFCRFAKKSENDKDYQKFLEEQSAWLENYAFYMALKNEFDGVEWLKFPEDVKSGKSLEKLREKTCEEQEFQKFLQFEFYKQWQSLHDYCKEIGVRIVGDIPIYTSLDSSDVFFSPELFQLDENKLPKAVAGCPPDAFSEDGQLWGNPLYDWEYQSGNNFEWWIGRIKHAFSLYDIVRIDHFRGFESYYSIPYGSKNAKKGKWVKGPDFSLFKQVKSQLGDVEIIAEDLGMIDKKVQRLLDRTGFCGMKVLQFAFGDTNRNKYLPHEYDKNCVVYTGTHDNTTTRAWFDELTEREKKRVCDYLNCESDTAVESMIRSAISSNAKYAVIPMADILELGASGRINTPSTLGGNWVWRVGRRDLSKTRATKVRKLCEIYGRI